MKFQTETRVVPSTSPSSGPRSLATGVPSSSPPAFRLAYPVARPFLLYTTRITLPHCVRHDSNQDAKDTYYWFDANQDEEDIRLDAEWRAYQDDDPPIWHDTFLWSVHETLVRDRWWVPTVFVLVSNILLQGLGTFLLYDEIIGF
jgi:hypothetical protein